MSIAYLFPGQGSQKIGMGRDLYERDPAARAIFSEADDILGISLSDICFNGPEDALVDTYNQQPALFVTALATLKAMETLGEPTPAYFAGHSLGEFSALVATGSLTFADGLRLVRKRAELMKEAGEKTSGAMAAVLGMENETLIDICRVAEMMTGQPVGLANDNCPGQLVISGETSALDKAIELANESGARKVVKLPVSIAAHSALMKTAATEFATLINDTPIADPTIPVIGNTTAQPLTTAADIRTELNAQLSGSVRWTESMQYLLAQGVDTFIEVGSGDVLTKLMKRIDRKVTRKKFTLPEDTD